MKVEDERSILQNASFKHVEDFYKTRCFIYLLDDVDVVALPVGYWFILRLKVTAFDIC